MNEIKCPQCGTVFQVDERGYADIARQVRDQEFSRQLAERERIMERERVAAVELAEQKAERQLQETVSGRDARIAELEAQYAAGEIERHAYFEKKRSLVHIYLKATTSPKRTFPEEY